MADEESHTDGKDYHYSADTSTSPKHYRSDAKGYVAFRSDDDDSSDYVEEETVKSPRDKKKLKKETARSNTFRDKFRSIKVKKKEKEVKEKSKEKDKEKEKEEKKEKREKKKHKRAALGSTEQISAVVPVADPVFGVPLEVAIARSRLVDGIELPKVFRDCVQYVEDKALGQEGIYRLSGVKSKIDLLKQEYDQGKDVSLEGYEPNIVTGLLKLYLRELPVNVLTVKLLPAFDSVVGLNDEQEQVDNYKQLLAVLPTPNRTLLSWLFVHLGHILEKSSENKMSIQNLSIVFSPTMAISHGILNIFFGHIKELFANTQIVRCTELAPQRKTRVLMQEHDETRLPDDPEALKTKLASEEEFLMQLHRRINEETDEKNEETLLKEVWEVQMRVTQIKRKLKVIRRREASRAKTEAHHVEPADVQRRGLPGEVQETKKTEVNTLVQTDTTKVIQETKNQYAEVKKQDAESDQEDLSEYFLEEERLLIEHEELLADNMMLKSRIERERNDIERLQQELAELMKREEELSGPDTSDTDRSSESESDSEENQAELQNILMELEKENAALKRESVDLVEKICEERQHCVLLRTQIRLYEMEKERSK